MIVLEGAGAWEVVAGEYAVFAVPVEGGRRRLLFRVGVGEELIGTDLTRWRLLAVRLETAEVRACERPDRTAWVNRLRACTGDPAGDLETWLDGEAAAEAARDAEAVQIRAEAGSAVETDAVRAVTGLLGAGTTGRASTRDPLMAALEIVGESLGIPLRAPQGQIAGRHPVHAVAQASRCRCRELTLSGRWWVEGGPALLAFEGEHPVALLPGRRTGYVRVDPRDRRRVPVTAERARRFRPDAFQLIRALPDGAVDLPSVTRFAVGGIGIELGRATAWGVLTTAALLAAPVATGLIVDRAIPDADVPSLVMLGASLVFITFAGATFQMAQLAALARLDALVAMNAQLALWDRLLRLPLSFFRRYAVGDLVQRAGAVTDMSRRLTGPALQATLAGALSIVDFVVLVAYSPSLALVALAVAVLNAALSIRPALTTVQAARSLARQRGRTFSSSVQLLGGVAKLQAAGVREAALGWWWREYRELLALQWQVWTGEDRLTVLGVVMPPVAAGVIFAAAAALPQDARPSPGSFIAFNSTFGIFLAALGSLTTAVVELAHARSDLARAQPVLEEAPEVRVGAADPGVLTGALDIVRLRFRYRADGPYVVDGLSLSVKPGEFVALVGASGCGKSTLLRLVLGFETPESGQVLLDGQDLAGLDGEAVRRQLGVVLQSGRLAAGTVLDAVAGANVVSIDEVWEALALAGLEEEVNALPMGIHSQVSEGGANLSGGQRQRLLIARALVHRPRLLILDEATAALDNRSQAEISENLARLSATRIVVAHRLSTIRHADRIFVLAGGRVVQEGSYDALAAIEGPFRTLVASHGREEE